jgi:hypothetical protein
MRKLTPEERVAWERKHPDYRSVIDGEPYVLHMPKGTGGTELWPLALAMKDRPEDYRAS